MLPSITAYYQGTGAEEGWGATRSVDREGQTGLLVLEVEGVRMEVVVGGRREGGHERHVVGGVDGHGGRSQKLLSSPGR